MVDGHGDDDRRRRGDSSRGVTTATATAVHVVPDSGRRRTKAAMAPGAFWAAAAVLVVAAAGLSGFPGAADAAPSFPSFPATQSRAESNEASRYLSLLPNFVEVPETRSSRVIPFEDSDEEDRKIMLQRRSSGGSYGRQNRAGSGRSKLLMRIFKRGGGRNGMMRYGRAMMRYGRSSPSEEQPE